GRRSGAAHSSARGPVRAMVASLRKGSNRAGGRRGGRARREWVREAAGQPDGVPPRSGSGRRGESPGPGRHPGRRIAANARIPEAGGAKNARRSAVSRRAGGVSPPVFFSPGGAVVNSQGRQPLVPGAPTQRESPGGATVPATCPALPPLRG